MLTRPFGKLGWSVSAIGLGTWNIGNQWGDIDEATAQATVHAALDRGVNLFDTAESYGIPQGLSEQRLGRALVGVRHEKVVVSKVGSWGRREGHVVPKSSVDLIRLCVHASLYRLRTDWIDVLLCHEGKLEDPGMYLEAFDRLKSDGLIRACGISTNNLDVLQRFNAHGQCDVLEIDYSLLNRKPEKEILPYCEQNGIAVLARGPLSKGLLSGGYSAQTVFTDTIRAKWHESEKEQNKLQKRLKAVATLESVLAGGEDLIDVALRFVMSHEAAPVAIPGAKSAAQARKNADAGRAVLSAEQCTRLLNSLE